ncbi:2448_t:CDS:2, partial [Funneliformis geosporum]
MENNGKFSQKQKKMQQTTLYFLVLISTKKNKNQTTDRGTLSVTSAKYTKFIIHESKICEEYDKLRNNSHFYEAISVDNKLVQLLGNDKLKTLYGNAVEESDERQIYLRVQNGDYLTNPNLMYENVAQFARAMKALKWTGPVVAMTDYIKVHAKLNYSQELGCIVGSTLCFNNMQITTYDDIHLKIKEIQDNKTIASQACVVLK